MYIGDDHYPRTGNPVLNQPVFYGPYYHRFHAYHHIVGYIPMIFPANYHNSPISFPSISCATSHDSWLSNMIYTFYMICI